MGELTRIAIVPACVSLLGIAAASLVMGAGGGSEPTSFVLTGIVRDFPPEPVCHPDFDDPHLYGPFCRYVQPQLDEDGKPVYSAGTGRRVHQEYRDAEGRKISWCLYDPARGDSQGNLGAASNGAIMSAETFAQWFRDVPGVNLSTTWDMRFEQVSGGEYAGAYAFETNDFDPFYPIDGELYGNGNSDHNYFFTFELDASFIYDATGEQFLRFKGDDDTWVFIEGQLVMDHGGIAGSREYYVDFNRLGLVDGERYSLQLFHAERKQPQSQFHLWTNVVLEQGVIGTVSAAFD